MLQAVKGRAARAASTKLFGRMISNNLALRWRTRCYLRPSASGSGKPRSQWRSAVRSVGWVRKQTNFKCPRCNIECSECSDDTGACGQYLVWPLPVLSPSQVILFQIKPFLINSFFLLFSLNIGHVHRDCQGVFALSSRSQLVSQGEGQQKQTCVPFWGSSRATWARLSELCA